jgi:hypothetical protein
MPARWQAVQITRNGGFLNKSFDGRFLYFLDHPQNWMADKATLMRIPVEGGEPSKILEGIRGTLWSLTRQGIFFVTRGGHADTVNLYRFEDGKVAPVGRLPFQISGSASCLAVSEDGRWLLTNQMNRRDTDLMLIENFK